MNVYTTWGGKQWSRPQKWLQSNAARYLRTHFFREDDIGCVKGSRPVTNPAVTDNVRVTIRVHAWVCDRGQRQGRTTHLPRGAWARHLRHGGLNAIAGISFSTQYGDAWFVTRYMVCISLLARRSTSDSGICNPRRQKCNPMILIWALKVHTYMQLRTRMHLFIHPYNTSSNRCRFLANSFWSRNRSAYSDIWG